MSPHQAGARAPARRIPLATYRLQFNSGFTVRQAGEILDYLDSLGVDTCYASPLFPAGAGSTHGYDICSHDQLNPVLGCAEDLEKFSASLRARKMGLLLDIVPNHMRADLSNPWWADVLRRGPRSRWANYFDIRWDSDRADLAGRVLLPVLGDRYARVLEQGEIKLAWENGGFFLTYYDRRFPLAVECCAELWAEMHEGKMPAPASPEEWQARAQSPAFQKRLAQLLEHYNGRPGEPASFNALHALLQRQHYRLAWWRVGPQEINYRRFFEISDLAGLRVERPEVFADSHRLVLRWISGGVVTGLRIDHPDGLWDPRGYLQRLQQAISTGDAAPGAGPGAGQFYVVAEKILTGDEPLPEDWPVDGTTGYDFLNQVNGLFVQPDNESALGESYRTFTGCDRSFEQVLHESKTQVLATAFAGELDALTGGLRQFAGRYKEGLDLATTELRAALGGFLAAMPVYRTYLNLESSALSAQDRAAVQQALEQAARRQPELPPQVWTFLGLVLLAGEDQQPPEWRPWIMRLQQLSGPVMAKGCEDTAFYRYHRLLSLNEVGGQPGRFGITLEQFHRFNTTHSARWPHSLLATATHDTKRGEDARARLNVLSELPRQWAAALDSWKGLEPEAERVSKVARRITRNDQYLFFQACLGAWPEMPDLAGPPTTTPRPAVTARVEPAFLERIQSYMLKAIREAKTHTSWTDPNADYENAVAHFVQRALGPASSFWASFLPLQRQLAWFGQLNSLSQVLLKLTAPGVPDFYQGTELWDLSLVDPDNRGPVDYQLRRRYLEEIVGHAGDPATQGQRWAGHLLSTSRTGQIKQHVIHAALEHRRQHPALFQRGDCVPVMVDGEQREHLCAFLRRNKGEQLLVVAPRFWVSLCQGKTILPNPQAAWGETALQLPAEHRVTKWTDLFTGSEHVPGKDIQGGTFKAAGLLAHFPVALLAHSGREV